MDLNEILVFTRVVQSGSFTSAARLLGMPKSSVSRKVSELEDRVGARLLQRTTRKLGLTDAGRIYFQHTARIVAELEEAEQAVAQMQAEPRGRLRVTAPLAFARLGSIASEFLSRYPAVTIDLVCTDRRIDLVEEGFDVAIRAGALDDSTLVARTLGAIRRVLVAAPAYCEHHGTPRRPADLHDHACIAFAAGPTPNLWVLSSGSDEKAEVRIEPRFTVNDLEIILEVTRAGIGIAALPEYLCAEDLASGRLQQVLPEWSTAEAPVHALYPTSRHLSPKVTAFIAMVADKLKLNG